MTGMTTSTRETTALNRAVAAQIRSLLGVRMLRQAQLASRMGVTEVWLSRRLREVQAMSLDDVERIAQALELAPAELIASAVKGTWQPTQPNVELPIRPRDNRPKTRSVSGQSHHRTRQKRPLTAEERSILAA
jgi:transcriptional regulator with XRE-family HTH domain